MGEFSKLTGVAVGTIPAGTFTLLGFTRRAADRVDGNAAVGLMAGAGSGIGVTGNTKVKVTDDVTNQSTPS